MTRGLHTRDVQEMGEDKRDTDTHLQVTCVTSRGVMPAWVKPHAREPPAEHTLGVVAGIVGNGPKGSLRKTMRNTWGADRAPGVPDPTFRRVRGLACRVSFVVKGNQTVQSVDGRTESEQRTGCAVTQPEFTAHGQVKEM